MEENEIYFDDVVVVGQRAIRVDYVKSLMGITKKREIDLDYYVVVELKSIEVLSWIIVVVQKEVVVHDVVDSKKDCWVKEKIAKDYQELKD